MRRKILSFLLAFCMVLTLVPAALAKESGGTGTEGGDTPKYNNYTLAEWISDMTAAINGLTITANTTELTLTDENRSHFLNVYANLDVFEAVKAEGITATEEQTNTVNGFKTSLEAIKKVDASGLTNKLKGFGTLVPYTKLEELNFSTNQVGDNGVLEASEIQVWGETLKVLNLSKTNVTNIDALVKAETTNGTTTWSEVFTALTTLDISETTVPNLNSLAYCSALTTLTAKNVMPEGGLDITGLLRLVDGEDFSTTDLSVDFTGTTVKDNLTEAQKAKINELIDGKNITGLDKYAVSGGDDPTPPTTEVTVTIGELETFPTESWWSGITKDKLIDGDLEFATEDQTVTVTGALKYAEWTAFNSEESGERAGHYLPLQIKLSDATRYSGQKVTIKGATEKVLNFSSDGSFELAMFLDKLDGKNDTTEGKFTITLGEGAGAKVYTVDCTGLTLLPKAADGTTVGTTKDNDVEAKPESDNSGTSVVIPADVDGLDEMTVKVTNVSDKTGLVPNDVNLAEGVADAIKGNGSKVVEVTVTKKNTSGGEDEQFTSSNPLQGKKITITIGGLTPNTTYYLFCITESSVTYCGNTFVTKASMEFTTTHLCKWAAVKENDDLKAANLVESDDGVKLNNGEAKTLTLTEASGKNGYSISLSGVSNAKYVVVQVKAKNSAVYAIGWYELKTSENTLYVGKGNGESVEVWLLSAEPTFTESGNFNNDQSNIVAYGKSN